MTGVQTCALPILHRHTFTELEPGKTLMKDEVRYRLPLEPLGDIAQFFVERQLKNIFGYRQKVIAELLDENA